ncbi:hypothetical protein BAE44_0007104, partial [Dichanthelium oligosanthes]
LGGRARRCAKAAPGLRERGGGPRRVDQAGRRAPRSPSRVGRIRGARGANRPPGRRRPRGGGGDERRRLLRTGVHDRRRGIPGRAAGSPGRGICLRSVGCRLCYLCHDNRNSRRHHDCIWYVLETGIQLLPLAKLQMLDCVLLGCLVCRERMPEPDDEAMDDRADSPVI